MPREGHRTDVQRLLAAAAQVVDVLPPPEYEEEHLPGAVTIPLKQPTAETTHGLDQLRAVIAYCHD